MNRIVLSIFLKHFCEKREREGERDFSLREYLEVNSLGHRVGICLIL